MVPNAKIRDPGMIELDRLSRDTTEVPMPDSIELNLKSIVDVLCSHCTLVWKSMTGIAEESETS